MALGACLRPSGALLAASGELLDGSWRPLQLSWWSLGELLWLSWRPMVRPKGFWSAPGERLGSNVQLKSYLPLGIRFFASKTCVPRGGLEGYLVSPGNKGVWNNPLVLPGNESLCSQNVRSQGELGGCIVPPGNEGFGATPSSPLGMKVSSTPLGMGV